MSGRVGLWIIGARGGVATTAAIGLAALRESTVDHAGLVSALPQFRHLDLVDWQQIELGGHEVRNSDCLTEAMQLANNSRAISRELVISVQPQLEALDRQIRPGVILNVGRAIESIADKKYVRHPASPKAAVAAIQSDLDEFLTTKKLERLIVVNLASTEPPFDQSSLPSTWAELEPQLESSSCCLPASSIYAIAALQRGWPYINFTPSAGSGPAAIRDLANRVGTCHMGHDGKTGETFLKSVLAPAFANRNLNIMSWVGHNIFGNMDGQILDDPLNKQTKMASKDKLLGDILGYQPQTLISIEYIKSLGDWKTAWDHIHFRGFLGTPMVMTFTWQGCDSILAAPLVLDLFRFTELAARKGETGLLTFLSSFFKSPLGVKENDFAKQFEMLVTWAAR
jgi:myo-inositol-1-phosphate synthase